MTLRGAGAKLLRGLALLGALGLGSSVASLLLVWYGWYAAVNDCGVAGGSGPCSLLAYLSSESLLLVPLVLGVGFAGLGLAFEPRKRRFAAVILVLIVLGFAGPMLYSLVPTSSPPPTAP